MIPGLNTDVAHGGVVFHVQTEDLGAKDPAILTLVYRGGAILLRVRTEYDATLRDGSSSQVKMLMESQHRRILRRVADDKVADDAPTPAQPYSPTVADSSPVNVSPSAQTLDDMITAYLRDRRRRKSG